jgi:hypothetical protein
MQTLTPTGKQRTWRRHLKIERIVRLTAAGYPDDMIALAMGITKVYVSMLRRTPEFLAVKQEVETGVISDYNRNLREDIDACGEELRSMLPEALLAVRDTLLDKSNPRLRLDAAKTIMDREGSLAAVSKSEVKTKVTYDFDQHDAIATDLLAALQSSTGTTVSNSLDEFINTSIDKDAQEKLHAALSLENTPPTTSTVQ